MGEHILSHEISAMTFGGPTVNILESMSDAFIFVDPQWIIVYMNRRAESILHYSRENLLGNNLWDIFPAGINSYSYQKCHQAMEEQVPVEFVDSYKLLNLWTEVRAFPASNGLAIYFTDVTQRVRVEDALRLSEERMSMALANSPITVYQQDSDLKYTWIYNTLPEFSPEHVLGTTDEAFILPEEANVLMAIKREVMLSGKGMRTEIKTTSIAGEHFFDLMVEPLRDARGDIIGVTGASVDITERKQFEERVRRAEQAYNESLNRFNLVVDATQLGIWYCDLPFDELMWNAKVKEHFWLPPDARVYIDQFYAILHPDDRERTREAIDYSIAHHTSYDIEYRTVSADGRIKWIRAIGQTFYDMEDNPYRFDGITIDITEQKAFEQRKDDFISMASHELKTPITTLKGLTQLLGRKLERDGVTGHVSFIDRMEKQINNLTRLINELLDVSKIQAGKLDYAQEPVDIDALLSDIVEIARQTTPSHTITMQGTAGVTVTGDRDRLEQVFTNLISNAVKYSPQANTVDVVIATTSENVTIYVRDYGIGIPREHQDKIFERFYRVHNTQERAFPGLGMGLYIAYGIIKRHGGDIIVSSEEGKGSTFTVTLPRQ